MSEQQQQLGCRSHRASYWSISSLGEGERDSASPLSAVWVLASGEFPGGAREGLCLSPLQVWVPWKRQTFTFDPLLVKVEGDGQTPAWRRIAEGRQATKEQGIS